MLPASLAVIAVLLRLASGASYIKATWQGKAQPSIVSWSFWGITALIAFVIQISKGSGPEAFVTLAIGISPIAVCVVALQKRAYRVTLTRTDKWCIALTTLGIVLWLTSRNPLMALYMSIIADICSSIPTILKTYRAPHTEHITTYALSVASMTIALAPTSNWQLSNWLFTAYILAINMTYVLNIDVFSKLRKPSGTENSASLQAVNGS